MTRITILRSIKAPPEVVFKTVADIREFSKVIPDIVNVEFLNDKVTEAGAKFRETRMVNGKEVAEEFEITEYIENERVRIVTDSHGTVWDTVFSVSVEDGETFLTMIMDAKPHKWLPRLLNPLMKGMITRAIGKDLDRVKEYCEKR